jgi:hypothetical protein
MMRSDLCPSRECLHLYFGRANGIPNVKVHSPAGRELGMGTGRKRFYKKFFPCRVTSSRYTERGLKVGL